MNLLNNISIRAKVLIGFGLLVVFFIGYTAFDIVNLRKTGQLTFMLYNHPLNVTRASINASMGVIKMHRGMKDVVLAENQHELEKAIRIVESEENKVLANLDIVEEKILGEKGKELERKARDIFLNWKPIRDEVIDLAVQNKKTEAAGITKGKGADYVRLVETAMLDLTHYARIKSEDFIKSAERTQGNTITIVITVVTVSIALMTLISYFLLQSILGPILSLKNTMAKITSTGKLTQADIPGNNEITDMTADFNKLIERLKMEIWDKDKQTQMSDTIRGENDSKKLCEKVLFFLCEHLNYQTGVFYLKDRQSDETFHLVSSYAYTVRNHNTTMIKTGEGLIGQAALEKKVIVYKDVPVDQLSLKIEPGTNEINPAMIVVIPLVYQENTIGIISMATTHKITDSEFQFIQRISYQIAVSLVSTISHAEVSELLEYSRAQAKELAQSNADLQKKSEALSTSEEQLKEKQKNLKEANTLLTEKSIEIQKKAMDLEKSSKYKSEFLANMSHELRSPLNSIILLSQILFQNQEKNLTQKQARYAETISNSGKELLNLINDVLDLSKIESGKFDTYPEKIVLSEWLEEINRRFSVQFEKKGLKYYSEVNKSAPREIFTDPKLLTQVLSNFLTNALKFTKEGSVSLMIGHPRESEKLHDLEINPQDAVAFRVSDTGIGIPLNKQEEIFGSFQQLDGSASREYEGTGLGLAIAKKLASQLQGTILLKSAPGTGSTFTLVIPQTLAGVASPPRQDDLTKTTAKEIQEEIPFIAAGPEEFTATATETERPQPQPKEIIEKPLSILLIEDDITFSSIVSELAADKNITVLRAYDGETGLKLAQEKVPDFILLDIYLNGMSGWDVLKQLKSDERTSSIPVQIISVAKPPGKEQLKNIFDYTEKPVSPEELNAVLNRIIEHHPARRKKEIKDKMKILVIDDDVTFVKLMKNEVEKKEIIFKSAHTGARGIELAQKNIPDVIILDIFLPDINGWEVVKKLKEDKKTSGIPIQVLTVDRDRSSEKKLEIYDFSRKPMGSLDIERMFEKIERVIGVVSPQTKIKPGTAVKTLQKKSVLLVEDNMRSVYALLPYLEDQQMKVTVKSNGKTALEYLADHPRFDLILMDIMMPEMDGYEAIEKIRKNKKTKSIPIIAVTAKAMKGEKEKILQTGANAYIPKPLDIDLLFNTMTKLVA